MTIQDPGRYMVQQMINASNNGEVFEAVPTEGATVNSPAAATTLFTALLNNTVDLNAVTFKFPVGAPDNCRVFIRAAHSIAALSVEAEPGVTVDNWTVNMAPGDCVVFLHATPNIWSRIS